MGFCDLGVPAFLAGPTFVLWCFAIVAPVSLFASWTSRNLVHLPRWLVVFVVPPATVWHELCHLAASVIVGHKITHIQLWGNRKSGLPAHIRFEYNPSNPLQTAGAALSGWAPVLISSAVLVFLVPKTGDFPLSLKILSYYGVALLVLAMPLSIADWRSVIFIGWTIIPVSSVIGWGIWPQGIGFCLPLVLLGQPAKLVLFIALGVAVGTWGLARAFSVR